MHVLECSVFQYDDMTAGLEVVAKLDGSAEC